MSCGAFFTTTSKWLFFRLFPLPISNLPTIQFAPQWTPTAYNPSENMEDKGTLEYALRPFRVEWEVVEEKHAAVLGMMEILLGKRRLQLF